MDYRSTDKPYSRGEICIRGHSIMREYYKAPDKTAETVDEDGWLHTGDIGLFDSANRLKIIDRRKNIFKLSQVKNNLYMIFNAKFVFTDSHRVNTLLLKKSKACIKSMSWLLRCLCTATRCSPRWLALSSLIRRHLSNGQLPSIQTGLQSSCVLRKRSKKRSSRNLQRTASRMIWKDLSRSRLSTWQWTSLQLKMTCCLLLLSWSVRQQKPNMPIRSRKCTLRCPTAEHSTEHPPHYIFFLFESVP